MYVKQTSKIPQLEESEMKINHAKMINKIIQLQVHACRSERAHTKGHTKDIFKSTF